jgi:arsenical pump membrane protein
MRLAIIGAVLLAAGTASVFAGILPVSDVAALVERVGPILVFVAAMTVVTELLSEAGLFLWFARRFRHWGRGRVVVLWLLVAAFAVATTVFLSLDTTAVLLTPVVVSVSRQAGLPVLPFALTTVWLANTGSLLLPISNLTNLLAQHTLGGVPPLEFAAMMLAPAMVAIVVPLLFIGIVFRKDLSKRYSRVHVARIRTARTGERLPGSPGVDRVLLASGAAVLAVLLPLLVSGIPVWIPSSVAAVALAGLFLVRRRQVLTPLLVPWSLLLFAAGLFLVMEAARHLGAPALLTALAGHGEGLGDLVRLAATGAVGSNLLNNLPAYLAAEPVAGSPTRVAALLVGVNAGPLITPWASLATLLWHDRLVKMNVLITWRGFAIFGALVAPVTVLAAVVALSAVAG